MSHYELMRLCGGTDHGESWSSDRWTFNGFGSGSLYDYWVGPKMSATGVHAKKIEAIVPRTSSDHNNYPVWEGEETVERVVEAIVNMHLKCISEALEREQKRKAA